MEQGDDGGKRHGASLAAALSGCTKQVSQRRARVNKRHLTWEVPPCYFCWLQAKDLGTEKGFSPRTISSLANHLCSK